MGVWLAFDIGCIECGEPSRPLGMFDTSDEATAVCDAAAEDQAANWHGQHSFQVFNMNHYQPAASGQEGETP